MKTTYVTYPRTLLVILYCLLMACAVPSTPTASSGKEIGDQLATSKGPDSPYDGPVKLTIDTGLITGTPGKIVDFSESETEDFSTQALPGGPIVFQESFTKANGELQEITRDFHVSDPSKRYTLHVLKHESSRGSEGQIQVNLNGGWTIQEKDFTAQSLEVMREGLLLNATNSLLVRLRGKPGARFTITVVEAGEAGTLLHRRVWEKAPSLTQADRLRNNDTNIFYPDDPASLGDLQPYEGDQVSGDGLGIYIGESLANGSRARIATGFVTVVLEKSNFSGLCAA